MLDQPSADAATALGAACFQTLASARGRQEDSITPRVESVVTLYLPWLSKAFPDLTSVSRELPGAERASAAEAMRWLAGLERFPAKSRQVLREMAAALTK
ncbi:MAG: hypothetical protein ACRD3M_02815, partial [Thermoanaerobaculia bacterium]